MARKTVISDDEILLAAREVFLETGPTATTAEVARRAGISEGSLFKRYATKNEMIIAAMKMRDEAPWQQGLPARVGVGDMSLQLADLMGELIAFFRMIAPRLALMSSCHIRIEDFFGAHREPPPVMGIRSLARYLSAEQQLGRIGPCDVEIVARVLLGASIQYAMHESHGVQAWLPMPQETFIRGTVALVFHGVAPAGSEQR